MKSIYEKFTDNEFEALKQIKKNRSWHDFILLLLQYSDEEDSEDNQKEVQENNEFTGQ